MKMLGALLVRGKIRALLRMLGARDVNLFPVSLHTSQAEENTTQLTLMHLLAAARLRTTPAGMVAITVVRSRSFLLFVDFFRSCTATSAMDSGGCSFDTPKQKRTATAARAQPTSWSSAERSLLRFHHATSRLLTMRREAYPMGEDAHVLAAHALDDAQTIARQS